MAYLLEINSDFENDWQVMSLSRFYKKKKRGRPQTKNFRSLYGALPVSTNL
jgi:hypothetical protein